MDYKIKEIECPMHGVMFVVCADLFESQPFYFKSEAERAAQSLRELEKNDTNNNQ